MRVYQYLAGSYLVSFPETAVDAPFSQDEDLPASGRLTRRGASGFTSSRSFL